MLERIRQAGRQSVAQAGFEPGQRVSGLDIGAGVLRQLQGVRQAEIEIQRCQASDIAVGQASYELRTASALGPHCAEEIDLAKRDTLHTQNVICGG